MERRLRPAAAQRLRPDRDLADRRARPASTRRAPISRSVRRCPGIELRIVDADGRVVPPRRGRRAARPRAERDARLLPRSGADGAGDRSPTGWFNTGISRARTSTGTSSSSGGRKELIIRSGFNVYPVEVEGVLDAASGRPPVRGRRAHGARERGGGRVRRAARRRRGDAGRAARVRRRAARALQAARRDRRAARAAGERDRQGAEGVLRERAQDGGVT